MDEVLIRDIAFKIGKAIEFLHEHGIVLRNLDSYGILMTDNCEHMIIPRISKLDKAQIIGG